MVTNATVPPKEIVEPAEHAQAAEPPKPARKGRGRKPKQTDD